MYCDPEEEELKASAACRINFLGLEALEIYEGDNPI
jgi:hypothetical protein